MCYFDLEGLAWLSFPQSREATPAERVQKQAAITSFDLRLSHQVHSFADPRVCQSQKRHFGCEHADRALAIKMARFKPSNNEQATVLNDQDVTQLAL